MLQALGLCAAGALLGLVVNTLRGNGLPWVTAPFDYQLSCEEKMGDARGNSVSVGEMARALGRADVAVVDIRSAETYAAGHVPGARNVAVSVVSATPAALMTPLAAFQEVLIYDDGAELGRAEEFAGELQGAKVTRVRFLDVGYTGWVAAGHPVSTGVQP